MKAGLFILLLSTQVGHSQNIDSLANCFPKKEDKVLAERVDTVQGLSKDQVYKKAKSWFVNYYKNSFAVIKLDDQESGQITGNGDFYLTELYGPSKGEHACRYTINVECKDGKYRIQLYDFKYDNEFPLDIIASVYSKKEKDRKILNGLCTFFRIETRKIFNSLKEAIAKQDDF